jgi:exonuclease SbcD
MRFIHTADWHLGRLFHSIHLTDDQRFALQGLVRLTEERQVDAVVVAGDIFDRAVPPTEAVDLLDETVAKLALEFKIPLIIIAGNHDSPARLEYFSGLARHAGVHVVGRVGAQPRPAEVTGADGTTVRFWPLAYTDPETARYELGRDDLHTHEAAIQAQLEAMGSAGAPSGGGAREVLVAHAFVAGSMESESERPLTVGGSGAVSAALFDRFDYVALGHLHRPQSTTATVRYAGSLLKYSFNEADHQKSVTLVELGSSGAATIEEVRLPVLHDVQQLRGRLEDVLAAGSEAAPREAYIEVILTDTEPTLNPLDRLRPVFPNILSVRREESFISASGPSVAASGLAARSVPELFSEFFKDVRGEEPTEAQTRELAAAIGDLERKRREVVAP